MPSVRASAMAGVLALLLAAGCGLPTPAAARAREPLASVLGITPGMQEEEAHRLLERLVIAWRRSAGKTRSGARSVSSTRHAEIGDPARARELGYTILTWAVPSRPGRPGRIVTARGGDPVFSATVSIVGTD